MLRLCLAQLEYAASSEEAQTKMETVLRERAADADIVVFPELFTSGYGFNYALKTKKIEEVAERPDVWFQRMRGACVANNVSVIFSFPEVADDANAVAAAKAEKAARLANIARATAAVAAATAAGSSADEIAAIVIPPTPSGSEGAGADDDINDGKRYFISLMWISSSGELLTCYRKTHLWDPYYTFERAVFTPGLAFAPVITYKGVRVGLLVCWDSEFPEPARVLRLEGAQLIIAVGANWDLFTMRNVFMGRAVENQVFFAYCNAVGSVFCGASAVFDPFGKCLMVMPPTTLADTAVTTSAASVVGGDCCGGAAATPAAAAAATSPAATSPASPAAAAAAAAAGTTSPRTVTSVGGSTYSIDDYIPPTSFPTASAGGSAVAVAPHEGVAVCDINPNTPGFTARRACSAFFEHRMPALYARIASEQ